LAKRDFGDYRGKNGDVCFSESNLVVLTIDSEHLCVIKKMSSISISEKCQSVWVKQLLVAKTVLLQL